jgi:hypothetical protein
MRKQPASAGGARIKQEDTMQEVRVYRWDNARNSKDFIGVIIERRKTERGNNYIDLLRLARKRFAIDAADSIHVIIDPTQSRRTILPEPVKDCSAR